MTKTTIVVVGATRGLGFELAKQYSTKPGSDVWGTSRGSHAESNLDLPCKNWLWDIDVSAEKGAERLSQALKETRIDILIITAGYFGKESFDEPSWEKEETMYKTSAIGPVFIVQKLAKSGSLREGSKVVLVSSESGSIGLRHESEGGGNYGHHASKAALNMVGKLLSLDLKEKGVAVTMVHPGFMRTEMTRSVGFDQFWDQGGAVTPEEAAKSMIEFIETVDLSKTGQYWAPRGPGDIGTAEEVLGPKDQLPTPLQLPW